MSNRILQVGGLAAAGGAAYYLYSAGGNPKLAEKKMERKHASFTFNAIWYADSSR
jgi:hypothetical protein